MSASAVGRVMAEDQPPEPWRSDKRPRGSPTGQTPLQQEKKTASVQQSKQGQQSRGQQSRRQLTFAWSDTEQSALVEFILLHKSCQSWPADQDYQFWSASAEFVAMRSKQKARSGVYHNGITLFLTSPAYVRCYSISLPHESDQGFE